MAVVGEIKVNINTGDIEEKLARIRDLAVELRGLGVSFDVPSSETPRPEYRDSFSDGGGSGLVIDKIRHGIEFVFRATGHEMFIIDNVEMADRLIDFVTAARNRTWGDR